MNKPDLETSQMISGMPLFIFSVKFYQLICLVEKKDSDKILEGDDKRKTLMDFLLYVIPHPDPNVEKSGHEWAIIKICERNKVKLLL